MKKLHKAAWSGFKVLSFCGVHNKTWVYKVANEWKDVTCKKCQKKKDGGK